MIYNKECSSTQLGSIHVVAMICVVICMLVVNSHVCVVTILAQVELAICGQQMRIGGLADLSAHPPPMTEKEKMNDYHVYLN